MKIVIDIPEETYDGIKMGMRNTDDMREVGNAIENGTPLPKGHGRLVDAEKIAREVNRAWTLWEKKGEDCYLFADVLTPLLVSQPTVIEADKDGDIEESDAEFMCKVMSKTVNKSTDDRNFIGGF